jgi:cholesterol transport system auxiliary component
MRPRSSTRNERPPPRPRRVSAASLARCALAAAGMLAAGACSVLGSAQRDPVTIYAPSVHVAPDPSWPRVGWRLALLPATSAPVIDTSRIAVRPTPDELQVYHGAAWTQPPPAWSRMRCCARWRIPAASAPWPVWKPACARFQARPRRAPVRGRLRRPAAHRHGGSQRQAAGRAGQRVVASHVFLHTQAASGTALPAVATLSARHSTRTCGRHRRLDLVSGQTDARTRLRP